MIIYSPLSFSTFIHECKNLQYKENDKLEIKQLTNNKYSEPVDMYSNMNNKYNTFYIIKDSKINKIVCTIILDTCNNLHYFVTKDLKSNNTRRFIKTIKHLAIETVKYNKIIYVTTALWYTQAIKFNKLIGFKCIEIDRYINISKWEYTNGK